jgi:hypothetical protein
MFSLQNSHFLLKLCTELCTGFRTIFLSYPLLNSVLQTYTQLCTKLCTVCNERVSSGLCIISLAAHDNANLLPLELRVYPCSVNVGAVRMGWGVVRTLSV